VLSWQNASANANGFRIDRAGEDGIFHNIDTISGSYLVGDNVSYSDNTASIHSTYTYQVQTIGDGGLSDPPTITDPVTTLAAVDSLAVNAISTTAIDVSWNVNVTDATAVHVERSSDGTTYADVSGALAATATIYHDTGLLANTDYWYRVRVSEPSGPSAYTDPSDAVTYPLLENVLGAAAATNKVNLQWTLDVTNASSIEVQRSANGTSYTSLVTLSGSATEYPDTTVGENNHYWYRIRATGPTGLSGFSTPVDVWTLPLQELTASAASVGGIDLSWSNISTTATAVEIDRSINGQDFTLLTDTLPGDATSFGDTGLAEDSRYWYRVRAIEPGGPSGFSAPADTSTLAAVDSLGATAVSANELALSWNLNATDATAIEVARSVDGINFTTLTPSLAGNATSFNDTGLDENTPYYYQVRAIQPAGPSSYTDSAGALTMPSVSGLTTFLYSTGLVQLTWTLNTTDATAIEVDRSDDGIDFSPLTTTLSGTALTYYDTDVNEGRQYYYQVRVIGPSGNSAFSDPAIATTEPIQNLTVTPGSTSQVLSWSNYS
jgi:titin